MNIILSGNSRIVKVKILIRNGFEETKFYPNESVLFTPIEPAEISGLLKIDALTISESMNNRSNFKPVNLLFDFNAEA